MREICTSSSTRGQRALLAGLLLWLLNAYQPNALVIIDRPANVLSSLNGQIGHLLQMLSRHRGALAFSFHHLRCAVYMPDHLPLFRFQCAACALSGGAVHKVGV